MHRCCWQNWIYNGVNDRSTLCCLAVFVKGTEQKLLLLHQTGRNCRSTTRSFDDEWDVRKSIILVISMLRADCAKRYLCGINKHDGMYGNNHHINSRNYCAWLCCFLVGETMKNITVCSTLCCSLSLPMWPNVIDNMLIYHNLYNILHFK